MYKNFKFVVIALAAIALFAGTYSADAAITEKAKNDKRFKQEKTQREARGLFDLQLNTVSNLEFYVTNYGIFGFNVAQGNGVGGGYWPRGSLNQYIFGGGIWFATKKIVQNDTVPLCLVTYNPNSGQSWTVPGRINRGGPLSTEFEDTPDVDPNDTKTYRSYFSTDFNSSTGQALIPDDGPNWPIWDSSDDPEDTLKIDRYFGEYVDIPEDGTDIRTRDNYPKGPAFISGEDIFATYKDTDLNYYEGGVQQRSNEGYPLKLQFEEIIYSWGFGRYKDFIFLKYEITNYSIDTLYDCWVAPVMDVDLARAPNLAFGAGNDRTSYYFQDSSLNMAYQWTNGDRGEAGFGFGYLGFDFLESPAVFQAYDENGLPVYDPANGYLRKDKKFYSNQEQLGLVSMRNWNIQDDKLQNTDRYQFLSEPILDGDNGPGDKRFMMSTGPFHMRPADTMRIVVGIMIANAAKGGNPDGTEDDVQELVSLDKFAQEVYDNNFRAPIPPDRTNFLDWKPLNNAVEVKWDNSAEMSLDENEKGLDFLGYRLFRARRIDLDTFSIDNISGGGDYPLGKGPLGWKQIAQWEMPTPFQKSVRRISEDQNNQNYSRIDSLLIVGPYTDDSGQIIDSMAIRCWRVPRGVRVYNNRTFSNTARPFVRYIDTTHFNKPWGGYYGQMAIRDGLDLLDFEEYTEDLNNPTKDYLTNYDQLKGTEFHDNVLETIIYLNRSLFKYNPLLMQPKLYKIGSEANKNDLYEKFELSVFSDGMIGDTVHRNVYDSTETTLIRIDTLRTSVDTVFIRNTLRREFIDNDYSWYIETLVPRPHSTIMSDTTGYVQSVLDSIYMYIQEGNKIGRVENYDFVNTPPVMEGVINSFMKEITNDRTFLDIGDDNRNQLIEADDDPMNTERLLNNMDYYYRMLAYDEGDWTSGTERKTNTGILRDNSFNSSDYFNIVRTAPRSSDIGDNSQFEIISIDSNLIGGLYNFDFFALDQERLNQDFAGHELELKFTPYWDVYSVALSSAPAATPLVFGPYRSYVTLTDVTTGDILFEDIIFYEQQACNYRYSEILSENGASVVVTYPNEDLIDSLVTPPDTITFHRYNNNEHIIRRGEFSTGDFTVQGYCYSSSVKPPAYGTLGFSFNYMMEQYGGAYRQYNNVETYKMPGEDAVTPINIVNGLLNANGDYDAKSLPDLTTTRLTQYVGVDMDLRQPVYGSFNNGPGEYEIEFLPGGTENVMMEYTNGTVKEFNVPYLNVRVKNVKEFKRPEPGSDSVFVKYDGDMQHKEIYPVDAEYSFTAGNSPLYNYNIYVSSGVYGQTHPDPINLAFENGQLSTENNLWIPKQVGFTNFGRQEYKVVTNDFIGKYNMHSYAFVNSRDIQFKFQFNKKGEEPYAIDQNSPFKAMGSSYSGLPQNRYYLSTKSTDGQDQLDFANVVNIGGLNYVFNYANAFNLFWDVKTNTGSPNNNQPDISNLLDKANFEFGPDFEVGDKVVLRSTGGAFGLPLPEAKVRVKVLEHAPENASYTDDEMDDILVVPNPYYVSHQGEKSPYDSKIYFTKLPPRCTISIHTITGDLIQTIEHDEFTSPEPGRTSVEVWNLLTDNNQRTQSQALVAHIKTPDGAETIKTFSIIVGGFRIITD